MSFHNRIDSKSLRRFLQLHQVKPQYLKLSKSSYGSGAFGKVLKATYAGAPVAVKIFNGTSDESTSSDSQVEEICLQFSLRHPNIISSFGYCRTRFQGRRALLFVMEAAERNLEDAVLKGHIKTEGQMLNVILQMTRSIHYLHTPHVLFNGSEFIVVHSDLKPANVLIKNQEVKLADFGIARIQECFKTCVTAVGLTDQYAPPELLAAVHGGRSRARNSKATDVWALGSICYFMATRLHPYSDCMNAMEHFTRLREHKLPRMPAEGTIPRWLDSLIRRGMAFDPAKRPTAEALLAELEKLATTIKLEPIGLTAAPATPATPATPAVVSPAPAPAPAGKQSAEQELQRAYTAMVGRTEIPALTPSLQRFLIATLESTSGRKHIKAFDEHGQRILHVLRGYARSGASPSPGCRRLVRAGAIKSTLKAIDAVGSAADVASLELLVRALKDMVLPHKTARPPPMRADDMPVLNRLLAGIKHPTDEVSSILVYFIGSLAADLQLVPDVPALLGLVHRHRHHHMVLFFGAQALARSVALLPDTAPLITPTNVTKLGELLAESTPQRFAPVKERAGDLCNQTIQLLLSTLHRMAFRDQNNAEALVRYGVHGLLFDVARQHEGRAGRQVLHSVVNVLLCLSMAEACVEQLGVDERLMRFLAESISQCAAQHASDPTVTPLAHAFASLAYNVTRLPAVSARPEARALLKRALGDATRVFTDGDVALWLRRVVSNLQQQK